MELEKRSMSDGLQSLEDDSMMMGLGKRAMVAGPRTLENEMMMMALGKRAMGFGPRTLENEMMMMGLGKRSMSNKNRGLWRMRAIRLAKQNLKVRLSKVQAGKKNTSYNVPAHSPN